jgi:hypothetical protein
VIAESLPVRILFTALPVSAIDALGDHLGLGHVVIARPHDRTLFAARDANANPTALILPFLDVPVAAHRALTHLLVLLAFAVGVLFDPLLGRVSDSFDLIRLGDALSHTNGARCWTTRARRGLLVGAGGGSSSHRGDGADQQSDTDGLPYHAISFIAVLADPPVHGLPRRWGDRKRLGITSPLVCPTWASAAGKRVQESLKTGESCADYAAPAEGAKETETAGRSLPDLREFRNDTQDFAARCRWRFSSLDVTSPGVPSCARPKLFKLTRCRVINWTIVCDNCNCSWRAAATYSIYERQALESRPCPRCGAYTLCCQERSRAAQRVKARHEPEHSRLSRLKAC